MKNLHISNSLSLPIDVVTQKLAFLGRTGSGKSYGSTKLAELMLAAKAQVIALDPVGIWYALRLAGSGKGFSIPVFGGLHGDIPIEPGAGAVIADLIVDRGFSAVIDLSQLLSSEMTKFSTEFATQFFQRKKAAPAAVHLFIEEAQEFVPQNVDSSETRKVQAFERLIKLGRNFGIGATLISQRPQEVNKKALNQTECLFAFQMTGPQERKAIESWISEKGVNDRIVDQLPHLRVGEPHVWSPQWLKISKTVKIAAKVTADVSSTPVAGAARVGTGELSPVDVEALREKMMATIEKQKADDPVELRKQIWALKKELEKVNKEIKPGPVVEKPVMTDKQIARIERLAQKMDDFVSLSQEMWGGYSVKWGEETKVIRDFLGKYANMQKNVHNLHIPSVPKLHQTSAVPHRPAAKPPGPAPEGEQGEATSRPQQRILDALASLEQLGLHDLDKSNVAVFADQSPTSSSYGNNLGRLRTIGLIHYPQLGRVALTDAGRSIAQVNDRVRTVADLHEAWYSKLEAPKVRILKHLIRIYPASVSKEELAAAAEASATSSSYGNNLGSLRSIGLIEYPERGAVVATALLFPPNLN